MPKKAKKPQTKLNKLISLIAQPRYRLVLFGVGFAAIGGFFIFRSFAATAVDPNSLRIATYNIKTGYFTDSSKHNVCASSPRYCMASRANMAVSIIRGNREGAIGSAPEQKAFDVIGFQEMEWAEWGDQWGAFTRRLPEYGHFPQLEENKSRRTIFWKQDRLQIIEGGKIMHASNYATSTSTKDGDAIWVKFRDRKTNKVFIVINQHLSVRSFANPDLNRSALKTAGAAATRDWIQDQWANDTSSPKTPIFLLGDMNSRLNLRDFDIAQGATRTLNQQKTMPYCLWTASGLVNAVDKLNGRSGVCPTKDPTNVNPNWLDVDHIYFRGAVTVDRMLRFAPPKDNPLFPASDHFPLYVDIRLSGASYQASSNRGEAINDPTPTIYKPYPSYVTGADL